MKLFFDTDVLLDVTLNRQDSDVVTQVISRARRAKIATYTSAVCMVNLYYVTRKILNRKCAELAVQYWLEELEILSPAKIQLTEALKLDFNDWEDAVQLVLALRKGCTHLISRNVKDYEKTSIIQVIDPKDMLLQLVEYSS